MNELTMPTTISVKQFDTSVSLKIEKSDTNVREMLELFEKVLLAHGYHQESIDSTICEIADKVREDVKQKPITWEEALSDDYINSIRNKYK